MCRQICIPSYSNRNDILDIMLDMENSNTDGFGYGYWENNKPFIFKSKYSLTTLLRNRKNKIFEHLRGGKFNNWTLAHMRAASCGEVKKENSHPFLVGNNIFCHNGTWADSSLVRLAMEKFVSFSSDTDSEVAAHLINKIGMKRFVKEVSFGGVFLQLNKSGKLTIGKISGELVSSELDNGTTLIASELDDEEFENQNDLDSGWYIFNQNGTPSISSLKYKPIKVISCSKIKDDYNNAPWGDYREYLMTERYYE